MASPSLSISSGCRHLLRLIASWQIAVLHVFAVVLCSSPPPAASRHGSPILLFTLADYNDYWRHYAFVITLSAASAIEIFSSLVFGLSTGFSLAIVFGWSNFQILIQLRQLPPASAGYAAVS
jgi:hypothetical protein